MKIRNGFVSNSSTSSFVVAVENWLFRNQKLTRRQKCLLIKFGFKPVNTFNPMTVMCTPQEELEKGIEGDYLSLGYFVYVNQDDVISFLAKERIPFKALTNYGTESVISDGHRIWFVPNKGINAEMYGIRVLKDPYFSPRGVQVEWCRDYDNKTGIWNKIRGISAKRRLRFQYVKKMKKLGALKKCILR